MALEYRDRESLVVQADLPGIDPERDLHITISHDVLHIRASRESGPEPKDHPSDLRYGTFTRDIALPPGTAEDQVTAVYREGKLEVRAPVGSAHTVVAVTVRVDHD
jgi:HSP20 family protein